MVDFTVTLTDVEGSGLTESQLDLLAEYTLIAANIWGRYINAPDVTIDIELNFNFFVRLAGAGSFRTDTIRVTEDGTEVFDFTSVAHLQTGIDVDEREADIRIVLNPERFDDLFFDPNPDERFGELGDVRIDFISLIIHEIGHGLGYGGAGSNDPLIDIPSLSTQSVFDTFIEEIDGLVVFTGPNAFALAGRNVELTGEASDGGEPLLVYHIGNLPVGFTDSSLAGLGSDLSPAALNGLAILGNRRYSPTAIDVAILTDLGVPIRTTTDGDDELYGFEIPDPEFAFIFETPPAEFLNGYDTIVGGEGDDTLFGLSGNDFLRGDAGNDHVIAGRGNDSVFAGASDDGNDTLEGGLGDDVLGGGTGDDVVIGGEQGADGLSTRDENMGAGSDTLFGGAGNDLLVAGSYDPETGQAVMTGPVTERLPFIITDRNVLFSGTGDDTLFGDNGPDVLGGGAGNDSITASAGNDTLFGGMGTGSDTLDGGTGDDEIFASGGDDSVRGGAGNDTLFGGNGNDTIDGGSDNDVIFGGAGDDTLTGGAGNDTFAFVTGFGTDTITDFGAAGSTDILDFSEIEGLTLNNIRTTATFAGGNATLTIGTHGTIILEGVTEAELQALFTNGQVLV